MSPQHVKKPRVEITYAIHTKGPLHVGTGHGAAGLHRAMLRDHNGLPYIPGSTIKGRARYAATRICDWMGVSVLKDAVGDKRSGGTPNGPSGVRDLPNRIFGCAWQRCTLRFGDARTDPTWIAARPDEQRRSEAERRMLRDRAYGLREVRTGAARSRRLGTIRQGHLYQTEVAPPGVVLSGEVWGYLDCRPPPDGSTLVEMLVLWLAIHLMIEDGVGGNKSTGSGKLALAPSTTIGMKVDGGVFAPKDDDVAAALGLLPLIEAAEG
ncbi:RAMP superfamily CRISPR-associated protein [Sorangium sp. So ce590]|uniref:RAMP superfamily CRISPR-associated protein n=1 Tax=Sorangium sp. So ce590 TaxID=3133317 RepID=UPI003F61E1FA